jgi:AraC-like DNA-binding protein
MGYRELAPPPAWRATLSCVWVRETAEDDLPVRVLPDAGVDVIWRRGGGVFVAGPDTTAKLTAPAPGTVLVGARFRPGAAGAALGVPMAELRDLRVGADDLDTVPSVDGSLSPAEALRALLRAIAPVPADAAVVAAARHGGSVAGAAADAGLSERQLRRRSLDAVGYGPKTLERVLRFQRFVRAADAGPDRSLADLAFDAGYADQAHLTRECGRLAGLPPAALRRSRATPPLPLLPLSGS